MPTTSFIRAAEIWVPDADGRALVSGGGLYGGRAEFQALSAGMRFAKGEGLPGEAWACRHPVVMRSFAGTSFLRIEAAAAAGLTSAVAMPVFDGEAIVAVVVLFCGDDAETVGAIEVWKNDPEESRQIGLAAGYYGAAELFEINSKMTKFGRGHGLPGLVWETGMPVVVRELVRSSRFLRREEALQVGLTHGFGLPFDYDPGRTWVMAILSALGTPIAREVEIWVPAASGDRLVFDAGTRDLAGAVGGTPRPDAIGPGEGLVGRAFGTGMPVLTEDCGTDAAWLLASEDDDGPRAALAFPVLDAEGALKAVTAWRF